MSPTPHDNTVSGEAIREGGAKHTPGPWKAAPWSARESGVTALVDGKRSDICGYALHENARLIAAAPELLAALQHILGGALSLPRFAEEEARAAIAKAVQS